MNDVIIVVATNQDINRLCEFEEQARLTEPDIWISKFNKPLYKEKLSTYDLDQMTSNKIIIAIQDNQVIGRCDLMILQSLFDFVKTGYIDWIYTLKDYRGQGIGKKLLNTAEDYFKSQDVNNYYLFTASNEQAQKFYHRHPDFEFSNKEVAEKEIK